VAKFKTSKELQKMVGVVLDETEYGMKLMVYEEGGKRIDQDNIRIMATSTLKPSVASNRVGENAYIEHFGTQNPRRMIVIYYGFSFEMRLRDKVLFDWPKKFLARVLEEIPGLEDKPREWFDLYNIVDLEFAILPDTPEYLDRYTYDDRWILMNVKKGSYRKTDRFLVPFEYGEKDVPLEVDMGEFKFAKTENNMALRQMVEALRNENDSLFHQLRIHKDVVKTIDTRLKNVSLAQTLESVEIGVKQKRTLKELDEVDERPANTGKRSEEQRD